MSFPHEVKDFESISFLDTSSFNDKMSVLINGKGQTGKFKLCENIISTVFKTDFEELNGLIVKNKSKNNKYNKFKNSTICDEFEYFDNYQQNLEKYDYIILDNVLFGHKEIERLIDTNTLTIITNELIIKYSLDVVQKLNFVFVNTTVKDDELFRFYNFYYKNFTNFEKFKLVLNRCSGDYDFLVKKNNPFNVFWYNVSLDLDNSEESYEIYGKDDTKKFIEDSYDDRSFSRSLSSDSLIDETQKAFEIIKDLNNKNNDPEDSYSSDSDCSEQISETFYKNDTLNEIPEKHEYSNFGFDFYKYFERCFIL